MKAIMKKDFMLVVIGQIISLFGNQILRTALPLYLLSQTGSAGLFGIISAVSFIPMLVLCPIGGIIADRVNKRNVMVILDFSTAVVMLIMSLLLGKMNIVILLLIVMVILYGIQGAYQPTVQASVPALLSKEHLMQGNSIINGVNALAGLVGPALGCTIYAFAGITPILRVCMICFLCSAIMEIFIVIPYKKAASKGSVFAIAGHDIKESLHFMKHEEKYILKISLLSTSINLFFTALILLGLPLIITKYLDFTPATASRLYGYSESVVSAGSLIGAVMAGVLAQKLTIKRGSVIFVSCIFTLLPIGLALQFVSSPMITYLIILASCVAMMILSTLFSIQMITLVQSLTPSHLIGKVMACVATICQCAVPIGQIIYGQLFEALGDKPYIPFYIATIITLGIGIKSISMFNQLDKHISAKKD